MYWQTVADCVLKLSLISCNIRYLIRISAGRCCVDATAPAGWQWRSDRQPVSVRQSAAATSCVLSPTVRVTRGAALDKARSSAVQWRGVKYHLDLGQLLAVLFVGQDCQTDWTFFGAMPCSWRSWGGCCGPNQGIQKARWGSTMGKHIPLLT